MQTIIAGWGYIDPDEEISGWQADHRFDKVADFQQWLAGYRA